MEAAYLIAQSGLRDINALAAQADSGSLSVADAARSINQRLEGTAQVYGEARAMTAAAGRMLRRHRSEFAVSPEMLQALKSLDDTALLQAVRSAQGDPVLLAEIAKPEAWSNLAARCTRGEAA